MSNRLFQCLLIFVMFQFFVQSVQASCFEVEQPATVNFNITSPIIVPQGAPVGTVIYETQVHAEYVLSQPQSCANYDSENDLLKGGATGLTNGLYSSWVFSTNITGIGYTFFVQGAGEFDNRQWGPINPQYYFVPGSDDYILRIIATSTNIGAGTLTPGLYGARKLAERGKGYQTLANMNINGGNIVSVCSVKDANISVPMGTVYDSEFTGPGSNSAEVKFKVAVNCPANSNVYVIMGGTADSDMTDGSVLALTPSEGNATGIGAQILYDGTPLKLNEKLFMKKAAGGDESLQFSARYIQTKPSITPGHANATGTLTITYE
ncbi:type 1 fimbrial protein [Lelliottia amnigena]|uniref:fimbrial protein n=1 Tax=Lelliottia amnigena TaxID=61646 RepID=UPI001575B3C7|nr:fimbrial protein [Lelliottia amnigena]NTX67967.1 type 1 fimbrial protein [Lelliottia amnigena]